MAKVSFELLDYDTFGELPIARKIVQVFTERAGIRPGHRVLDVGGGTGESAKAILERLKTRAGWNGRVTLLEPVSKFLQVARERLQGTPVEFVQGYAEDLDELDFDDGTFEVAVWSNGIHYVEDETGLERVLRSIRRVTRRKFIAWTTFMSEAYVGKTARFAGLWVLTACRRLGIDSKRERVRSENLQERGSKEYLAALRGAGFSTAKTRLETFDLPPEAYEAIARFGDYVRNALPDIPSRPEITLALRSQALVESVREVYDRLGVETLPRNWLCLEAEP